PQPGRLAVQHFRAAVGPLDRLPRQSADAVFRREVPASPEAIRSTDQFEDEFALGFLDLDLTLQDQVAHPVHAVRASRGVSAGGGPPLFELRLPSPFCVAVLAHEAGDGGGLALVLPQRVPVAPPPPLFPAIADARAVSEGLAVILGLPGVGVGS